MGERRNRLVLLGTVVRAHGVQGEVSVRADDADLARELTQQKVLWIQTGSAAAEERNIVSARMTAKGINLLLEGVNDRNGAELLRGARLFQKRSLLTTVGEGEFLTGDLTGLTAVTPEGRKLGRVADVEGAGEVMNLIVQTDGGEIQVPFAEPFLHEVRLDDDIVILEPPEDSETPES